MIPFSDHSALTQALGFVDRSWTTPQRLTLAARDYAAASGPARLPVFCLHGLTRNARDFENVAPAIAAQGRRVLAFDVRGRGRSAYSPRSEEYAVPVYAADVIGWAKALGVARAVFVGTSMGGLITMALAGLAPDLVAAAVLNDIGPEIDPVGLARISAYVGQRPKAVDWREAAAVAAGINGASFPNYGPDDWAAFGRRVFRETDGGLVLDYDPRIAEPMAAGAGRSVPPMWDLFDTLARDRPLLVVRGALSDLLASSTLRAMADRATDMQSVEVADVGHAPSLSEPEAVSAIATFLAGVP